KKKPGRKATTPKPALVKKSSARKPAAKKTAKAPAATPAPSQPPASEKPNAAPLRTHTSQPEKDLQRVPASTVACSPSSANRASVEIPLSSLALTRATRQDFAIPESCKSRT